MKTLFSNLVIIGLVFIGLLATSCVQKSPKPESQVQPESETDATPVSGGAIETNMTREKVAVLNWMNSPESYGVENRSLRITVEEGTDFFNNPEDLSVVGTAPFLYQEIEGDFVAKTLVEPDFSSQWNAVALMLYIDNENWIKFAFENSDATGPTIVTVVTKETSDDANGVILSGHKKVWLALARKGNIYSMHWSVDGKDYKMARLTAMSEQEVVKIGIEAQAPVGDSASHLIHYFDIQEQTVADLRNINTSHD